ncbi:(2Fe-2S) ferredoxin domain-containing protein [Soehngenia longivitae]|uniref:(2Fe-2S) ferredoxin domain-containing protein n=1 Tax=Soehngenia longivitae TaxID=2562294 RepID=A0A4Z0D4I0_9FIRM|nr:NAD(P)H-dependent oxidoreductase subunit E [Soehngenia longivitae]TFZ39152.1 (2Fe-2S) ferredoxin domain-containing protein [Soehngenia longivitae]
MKVKVCMGSNCTLLGAMNLLDQIESLRELIEENKEYKDEELEIESIKCLGYCKETDEDISPVVIVDEDVIFKATGQIVMEKIMDKMRIKS